VASDARERTLPLRRRARVAYRGDSGDLDMSTVAAKIDRFVRWFFNVSPTKTEIEPRPRRRASSSSRQARPASPKDRRDARPAERRDARSAPSTKAARSGDVDGA
jgi:hypothetical protein